MIEALLWAPSAGNLQSRKFYFVFNNHVRKQLARAAGNPDAIARVKKLLKAILDKSFIDKAPLVVVACIDRRISLTYGERGVGLYAIQDAAASVMNMMLVAHESGLGSVWIGAFNEQRVAEALTLPGNLRPVAIVPLGYPAVVPAPPGRTARERAVEFVM